MRKNMWRNNDSWSGSMNHMLRICPMYKHAYA